MCVHVPPPPKKTKSGRWTASKTPSLSLTLLDLLILCCAELPTSCCELVQAGASGPELASSCCVELCAEGGSEAAAAAGAAVAEPRSASAWLAEAPMLESREVRDALRAGDWWRARGEDSVDGRGQDRRQQRQRRENQHAAKQVLL